MSSTTDIVVAGIDGGGTRTRAAIVDGTGRVVGYGESGPSNIHVVGRDVARDAIAAAMSAASDSAGLASTRVAAAFLGVAGVGSAHDRDELRSIARELDLSPEETLGVDHDLRIAHAGGLAGEPGIVLIAGTGSSCYGRSSEGISWRSGGWGPLLDDAGGGYWLVVQAIAAVTRAVDGRGPATSLEGSLKNALGIDDTNELLRLTGRGGLTREQLAEHAPIILAADDNGDEVARDIVRRGVDELARMVQAVVGNLGMMDARVPLVFTGGLSMNKAYRDELELTVDNRAENVALVEAKMPPVLGAALLALELSGALQPEAVASLQESTIHSQG